MESMMREEIMHQPFMLDALIKKHAKTIMKQRMGFTNKYFILAGTGASYNACQASANAFILHSRLFPYVFHSNELLKLPESILQESDILLVSQSGESIETKAVCDHVKGSGARLAAVTNNPESYLGKSSDEMFFLEAGPEISSATKTWSATVMLLYLLACEDNRNLKMLEMIPHWTETVILKCQDFVKLTADRICDDPGYIAGVDYQTPCADQGALLLKEKCFLHIEGLSINELRHGTIEAVDKNTPVILIASDDKERNMVKRHIDYLSEITDNLFLISNQETVSSSDKIVAYVNGSKMLPEFSHISHVALLQMLALHIAEEKGYDIDGFKYLSKIVDKY